MIFDPVAAKNMATANNAELVKMCGPRDPFPGKLGVIEEGVLADMILLGTQIR